MGVTAIKSVDNKTNQGVVVMNFENHDNDAKVPDNHTAGVNMWIPWCTNSGDFKAHHIEFRIPATGKTWYVWQNGDIVRYSSGAWAAAADPVPGHAHVDGDRVVTVTPDGDLLFEPTEQQ